MRPTLNEVLCYSALNAVMHSKYTTERNNVRFLPGTATYTKKNGTVVTLWIHLVLISFVF